MSASHTSGASLGVEQQLDPVLAGVAGAADEHRRTRHRCAGSTWQARRQRAVGELGRRARAPAGPARRASRSPRGGRARRRRTRRRARLQPGEVLFVVRGVGDGQELAVGQAVGEQVVEHAAVLAAASRCTGRRPRGVRRTSFDSMRCRNSSACGPRRLDLAHVRDVEHARARGGPRGAPRGCRRTGPASPSRRTGPASRRRRRGGRRAGCDVIRWWTTPTRMLGGIAHAARLNQPLRARSAASSGRSATPPTTPAWSCRGSRAGPSG